MPENGLNVWVYDHNRAKDPGSKCHLSCCIDSSSDSIKCTNFEDWDTFYSEIEKQEATPFFEICVLHSNSKTRTAMEEFVQRNLLFGLVITSENGHTNLTSYHAPEKKKVGVVAVSDIPTSKVVSTTNVLGEKFLQFLAKLLPKLKESAVGNRKGCFVKCFYEVFPDSKAEQQVDNRKQIERLLDDLFSLSLAPSSDDVQKMQHAARDGLRQLGVRVVADGRE